MRLRPASPRGAFGSFEGCSVRLFRTFQSRCAARSYPLISLYGSRYGSEILRWCRSGSPVGNGEFGLSEASHGCQTELPEKVTVQLLEAEPSPAQNLEGKYINKTHSTDLSILLKNPMSLKSAQIWISRFFGTSIYYAKRLSEYTIPERKRKGFSETIIPSWEISRIAPHKQRVSGFFRSQCMTGDADKVSACCRKCRHNIPLFRQGRVIIPPWRFCC